MKAWPFIFIVSIGCQPKQQEKTVLADSTSNTVTTQDSYENPEAATTYKEFCGAYNHESSTKGFSAILTLKENGSDLYFTLSVQQGNCKREIEGVAMMVSADNFPTGFYQSDNCRLQFTFSNVAKIAVDIKEVSFCSLQDGSCSFEGTYAKTKTL